MQEKVHFRFLWQTREVECLNLLQSLCHVSGFLSLIPLSRRFHNSCTIHVHLKTGKDKCSAFTSQI